MPQSEDIAPFIGIYHAYRLYRRQSLERTLQLLYAPIIQQLQRELTSRMDKWTLSLQMGFKAIESLQQRLRLGLRIVTMRSEEAQYMANVSLLSTTDEASRGRRLDWARCLLQWSESCAEWVNSFENGLKALNNHRMVLQTRQMRRREEIANLRLDVDGLGGLVKMNAAINAHRVEMVNFYHGIQSLHESVGTIPLVFGCQQDPSADPMFYGTQREIINESTTWAMDFMKSFDALKQPFNFHDRRTESSPFDMIQHLIA